MRITNKVLVKGFLSDLTSNLENMKKYQEQLSSGQEIRRPSDNPFKVARAMELKSGIAANDRYKTNLDEGMGWLETSDTALGQINDALQRVRELAFEGGNPSYSDTQKYAIKTEIDQLKDSLVQIGNTVYDGRYIFGGDSTTTPPFTMDSSRTVTYNGSAEGLVKEFSQGVTLDISTSGDKFSKPQGSDKEGGIFKVIESISQKLGKGESTSDLLGELDSNIDNILRLRSEVGAKANRLDAMQQKNEEETYNMTELLSKTADIDVAQKVMEYKVAENVYTSALQTGAKILQPSLLDFLR